MNRARRTPAVMLVLAMLLLFAQGVAQAHAYTHLKAGTNTSDFSGTATQLCAECLGSATVLGTAGPPRGPQISFSAPVTMPVEAVAILSAEVPRHYAFRSRAPPASRS
ncbi:MAG: hypothetical protein ABI885_11880 [Gammaproteobacteria bacterium]